MEGIRLSHRCTRDLPALRRRASLGTMLHDMIKTLGNLGWAMVALTGAAAVGVIAVHRGEPINALWLVVAATCCYALGYRFYSRLNAAKARALYGKLATPASRQQQVCEIVRPNHT